MDLFRKLGVGAKFDLKRFQTDARKLKLLPSPNTEEHDTGRKKLDFFQDSKASRQKRKLPSDHEVVKEKKDKGDSEGSETSDNDDDDDNDEENIVESSNGEDESEPIADSEQEEELTLLGSMKSKDQHLAKEEKKRLKKKKIVTSDKMASIRQEKMNHLRKINRIQVQGSDILDPLSSFDTLVDEGLNPTVVENLKALGFTEPTPIQMQAIPFMLQGRELLACAPTGSGKTVAFVVPVLYKLKEPQRAGFRALILSPTRELATQTYRVFCQVADGTGFRIHYIDKCSTAAKKFGPNSSQKFDILITTPNRLVYMLQQDPPLVSLKNIEWLIVDESDKLFEEGKRGFRDQLAAVYQACDGRHTRRAMFSATFAHDVEQWCKLHLDNVVQVYIGARNSATDTVKQELMFVGGESGKLIAMRNIIMKGLTPPVLIFVQSKDRAKELFHELIYDGINVDVIHSDRTQLQRDNIVKSFRAGKVWILICTDLMGRGIDFKGVNLVINYDVPNSAISYIHRIGRTGRAGRPGQAITFFTEADRPSLRSIANVLKTSGCDVPDYMLKLPILRKDDRRKLAKSAPYRKSISTTPKHEVKAALRKKKMIKRLKKGPKPMDETKKAEESSNRDLGNSQGEKSVTPANRSHQQPKPLNGKHRHNGKQTRPTKKKIKKKHLK